MCNLARRRTMCGLWAVAIVAFCADNASAFCNRSNGAVVSASTIGTNGATFTQKHSVTQVVSPRFLGMLSYFGAMKPGHTAYAQIFPALCDLGFSGVRIFADFWASSPTLAACQAGTAHLPSADAVINDAGGVNPARAAQLQAVLLAARNAGLVVDLSFAYEVVINRTVEEHRAGITTLMANYLNSSSYDHVMVDVQNEWDNIPRNARVGNGPVDCSRTSLATDIPNLLLAGKAGNPNSSRVVFASTGESYASLATAYANGVGRALAPHDSRLSHWTYTPYWTNLQSWVMSVAPAVRIPIYAQEPNMWTSSNGVTNEMLYSSALNAKARGAAAWTFHTESLFFPTNTYPYGLSSEELDFMGVNGAYYDMLEAMINDCWGYAAAPGWLPATCM